MEKTIWIIRHGETELNAKGIVQGQGMNVPLSRKGFEQAAHFWKEYAAEPFDLILYSNLIRSQQSVMKFLTAGIQSTELADLREISWGVNEGKPPSPDVLSRYHTVLSAWLSGDYDAAVENGESANQLAKRAENCIDYFTHVNRNNILVCSHGRTIRALVCLMLGNPLTMMEEYHHSNLGLYKFVLSDGVWQCIARDDVQHLI